MAARLRISFTDCSRYTPCCACDPVRNVAIAQDGGPDAPFRLQLLTSVQPHKNMAHRMAERRPPRGEVGGEGQEEVSEALRHEGHEAAEDELAAAVGDRPSGGATAGRGRPHKGTVDVAEERGEDNGGGAENDNGGDVPPAAQGGKKEAKAAGKLQKEQPSRASKKARGKA